MKISSPARLTEDENASFSAQIARSPLLQEKVGSFRILTRCARKADSTRLASGSHPAFSRFAILISPALATMLCIAIFLYCPGV